MLFILAANGTIHQLDEPTSSSDSGIYYARGYAPDSFACHGELALPARGCLTQAVVESASLRILTDHAGAYPLYEATTSAGDIVIGHDAWAVARQADLSTLNSAACFDMLAFEYVPGYETLVEGLTEIEPAMRLEFRYKDGRWHRTASKAWHFTRTPSDNPVSEDAAYENLMYAMQTVAAFAAKSPSPVAINLSGGWDSRAILAGAHRHGISPLVACSYGNPDYLGVQIAAQAAAALKIPHKLYPFHNASFLTRNFDNLCATMPPTTRFNLADGAMAMGSGLYKDCLGVLCGHVGDVTKLRAARDTPLNTEQDLTTWLNGNLRGTFREPLLRKLILGNIAEDISHQILTRLRSSVDQVFAPGSAGIFHWRFRNRARRGVLVELRMLERFVPTIFTPMLEKSFLEFWMTVPDSQMYDQTLYRRMLLKKLFTEDQAALARIPRESGTPLNPDSPLAAVSEKFHTNYHRVLRRLSPATAARKTAADPTALWWHQDVGLRHWAWRTLENSQFVNTYFDIEYLRNQVHRPRPADPSFARIFIWNLLTVAGIEKNLQNTITPAQSSR